MDIEDSAVYGIGGLLGNDHVIEYNDVIRCGLPLDQHPGAAGDMGVMGSYGDPTYRAIYRYNRFAEIGVNLDGGHAAIRLDDAISGMVIYGNIFDRCGDNLNPKGGMGALNYNAGRDNICDNNIFLRCPKVQTGGFNPNNDCWERILKKGTMTEPLYLSRYPDLKNYLKDGVINTSGFNHLWRNIIVDCPAIVRPGFGAPIESFDLMDLAVYANQDPGFVDMAKGDFRLAKNAPVLNRIGFRPIPVEEIGLYEDEYRASWPMDMPAARLRDRSGQPGVEVVSAPATPASAAMAAKTWNLGARAGRQCLITPEGKSFLMLGISHVGGALGGLKGAERGKRLVEIEKQLRGWGFNTVPSSEFWDRFPFIVPLDRLVGAGESRFEDVFDPEFKTRLRKKIVTACEKTKTNPNCIGYWWTDIPPWPLSSKTKFGKNWVEFIRDLPDTAPGKKRYAEFLAAPGSHDDLAFLRLIARELYTDSAAAFRECDPKGLIFGERYDTFNVPTEILEEAAKVVDVISVQPYEGKFNEVKYDQWHELTGKPIVISDWNLSFPTPEHSVTMWPQFKTQSEAATAYETYLHAAFVKPYILGYFKCQYVDQVLPTGMLKQGLLQAGGEPYEEFTGRLKAIHQKLMAEFN